MGLFGGFFRVFSGFFGFFRVFSGFVWVGTSLAWPVAIICQVDSAVFVVAVFVVVVLVVVSSSLRVEKRLVVRIEDVEEDGEEGAGGVDAERNPPDELLVKLLLEILEHEQTDGETGQGTRQMSHVRHGRTHLLRRVPVINGEANVSTR